MGGREKIAQIMTTVPTTAPISRSPKPIEARNLAVLGLDTLFKLVLFCLYIGLWSLVSILVHVSQRTGQPVYNPSTAVLFTEVIKLGISIVFYLARDGNTMDLIKSVCASSRTLALYAVPGALYCAYNNLLYYNLSILDPGSYNMLMQLRIVATAALHSAVFSIRLRGLQWIALLLICAGTLLAPPGACLLCPLPSTVAPTSDVIMSAHFPQASSSRRPRRISSSRTASCQRDSCQTGSPNMAVTP